MTEEAGVLGDCNMGTDDDLRMTTGASQMPAPPLLFQVRPMVKDNPPLEGNLTLQEPLGMTAWAEAAGILDLRVRLGAVSAGDELCHLGCGLKFDPHPVPCTWRVVAVDASNEVMLGGLPGLIIRPHDMTTIAEPRAGAVFIKAYKADYKKDP